MTYLKKQGNSDAWSPSNAAANIGSAYAQGAPTVGIWAAHPMPNTGINITGMFQLKWSWGKLLQNTGSALRYAALQLSTGSWPPTLPMQGTLTLGCPQAAHGQLTQLLNKYDSAHLHTGMPQANFTWCESVHWLQRYGFHKIQKSSLPRLPSNYPWSAHHLPRSCRIQAKHAYTLIGFNLI